MIFIAFLLGTSIFGFLYLRNTVIKFVQQTRFANEFLEKLILYVQSQGSDRETMIWLFNKCNKMQVQAGSTAIASNYQPNPFANYYFTNYPILLNGISELRQALENNSSPITVVPLYTKMEEALLRHIGVLEDSEEQYRRKMHNPLICFQTGVNLILTLPIQLLSWFGIIGQSFVNFLVRSSLFRAISGLIALVAFASSIIGILTGWDEFVLIFSNLLQGF